MTAHVGDDLLIDHIPIVWDYGIGAYGPTIRVVLPDQAAVAILKRMFLELAEIDDTIELSQRSDMRLLHFSGLALTVARRYSQRTVHKLDDSPSFLWKGTSSQWFSTVRLLDPFTQGRSGHQYLGEGDALIEVSFNE
jgi:hypothetical protein